MIVWNEFLNDARVLKEAQTLQNAGYQVTVHALHTPSITLERETLQCGVKVVRVARSPLWKWRKNYQAVHKDKPQAKKAIGHFKDAPLKDHLLRIIARTWTHGGLLYQLIRSKPDAVQAHDVNTLPTAWLASVFTKVPLVYDAHEISTDREGYTGVRKLVGWVEKKLMPRAAGTITTTDIRAKFFALAYGVPRPLVLQNRPRLTRVPKNQKIRIELGLELDWPIVLYQGGLQQGRGLERIIDAAQYVKKSYFVFIGGGRLELPLKQKVARLGLEEKVHFIKTVPLDDLPEFTSSADIGIQALENTCLNHYSTDSNKLFEYMMAGLPVIASNLPEIRKIINQFELGLIVPSSDTEALVKAIQKLVDQPDLQKKFHENALNSRITLNWEDQEEKLIGLYKTILRERIV